MVRVQTLPARNMDQLRLSSHFDINTFRRSRTLSVLYTCSCAITRASSSMTRPAKTSRTACPTTLSAHAAECPCPRRKAEPHTTPQPSTHNPSTEPRQQKTLLCIFSYITCIYDNKTSIYRGSTGRHFKQYLLIGTDAVLHHLSIITMVITGVICDTAVRCRDCVQFLTASG